MIATTVDAQRSASTLGPESERADSPVQERIRALDVVRGVAVCGILLANVLVFFGIFTMTPAREAAMPTASADVIARFLERVLVDGKFYSMFSLLFGIGFGVQLRRGGEAAEPRFRRRLRVLLGIGALHALVWAGDILLVYAMLGFTMPWFARKSDRALLRWAVGLLATPTALYVVALIAWTVVGPASSPGAPDAGMPPGILPFFEAMGRGGVKDWLVGNLVFVGLRWADLFATVRFPKVLGMFVLGLWMVRSGIALSPAAHRQTLARWSALGIGVGLPANLIAAWGAGHWPYLMPSAGGLLNVVMQAIGVPMLALGYAAAIALLVVNERRLAAPFGPMGRMALTNYLTHSVVCVVLSYGFGFGLWWRVGASRAMLVAAAILAVQIPLSAWWLSRHRFGPAEWVWRRLTYGRPI